MKQQIIVSGIGGQGALFLTRVIARTGVDLGLPVLTSESHGMAQRGGSVLSTLKIGTFASPLIRSGQGDVGLFLWDENLPLHGSLIRPDGLLLVNGLGAGDGVRIDAAAMARELGNAVLANLVLLGLAVQKKALFCTADGCIAAIKALAPEKYLNQNLAAFDTGFKYSK